jgi:hypothetical protein
MTKVLLPVMLAMLLLAACSNTAAGTDAASPSGEPPTPAPAVQDVKPITCSTFYRSRETQPPKDGPVLTFDQPEQSETARFDDLVLRGQHINDEFEGRSLSVSVSEEGRKHPLFNQLFQMEANGAPENIFGVTGQGFTGLLYAYAASGAELQFFCRSG